MRPTVCAAVALLAGFLPGCGSMGASPSTEALHTRAAERSDTEVGPGDLQLRQLPEGLALVHPGTHTSVLFEADGSARLLPHSRNGVAPALATRRVTVGGVAVDVAGAAHAGACDPDDPRRDVRGDCLHRAEVVSGAVTAWWANDATGLRQGWTIAEGTPGPLVVDVVVDGLPTAVTDDGQRLRVGAAGAGFEGTALHAWDADGVPLPLHAEATADGFALVVDAADATFPVHVDPTWVPWAWRFEAVAAVAAFASGDLDGDGYPELLIGAVATSSLGRVYVFAGTPTGPAATPSQVWQEGTSTDRFGTSLAVGDVDHDGIDDAVVGSTGTGSVRAFLGAPGVLPAASSWTLAGPSSSQFGAAVAVLDVDGDGLDDLAVGAPSADDGQTDEGIVHLYPGVAGGIDTTPLRRWASDLDCARLGQTLAVGDWNGDGVDDLVAASEDGARVWLGGAVVPTVPGLAYGGADSNVHGLASGDVNGDGWDDLVVNQASFSQSPELVGEVRVLLGGPTLWPTVAVGGRGLASSHQHGYALAVGDFDGDGDGDVAAGFLNFTNGQLQEGAVRLYRGGSSVTSTPYGGVESDAAGAAMGRVLHAADLDGDGVDELLVASGTSTMLLRDSAASGWSTPGVLLGDLAQSPRFGAGMAIADVNADGVADVLLGAPGHANPSTREGALYVYQGLGGGAVATAPIWRWETNVANSAAGGSLARGDLNGDGLEDLAVSGEEFVYVFYGTTSGLPTAPDRSVTAADQDAPSALLVVDVTGDGVDDLVVGTASANRTTDGGTVLVFAGGATLPTFPTYTLHGGQASSSFGAAVAAGDLNGDGVADLVVGAPRFSNGELSEGRVYVYVGSTSAAPQLIATFEADQANAGMGTAVAFADMNRDGLEDVLVGAPRSNGTLAGEGRVEVYLSTGAGMPLTADHTWYGGRAGAEFGRRMLAGDVNGDGYREVVVDGALPFGSYGVDAGHVSLFLGTPAGPGPLPAWVSPVGASPDDDPRLAFGDLDGDGREDLLVSTSSCYGAFARGCVMAFRGTATGLTAGPGAGDADGDGVPTAADCNDLDPNVGAVGTYYVDGDGDGWGDVAFTGCGVPGSSAVGGDCDDADPAVSPGAVDVVGDSVDQDCDGHALCYADVDGDTYRTEAVVVSEDADCADPGEALASRPATDCDDTDPTVRPGVTDPAGDGIDQNCDGRWFCYRDLDDDGARTSSTVESEDADCDDVGEGWASEPIDCNDGDATIFPGATELPGDGVNQDCTTGELCFADADNDGYRATDVVVSADNDCIDSGEALATEPDGDCADDDAARFPGAAEIVADGIDGDCDGGEVCLLDADLDGRADATGYTIPSADADCDDPYEAGLGDPPDLCFGVDARGDYDGDGLCNGTDVCPVDVGEDADADGVCDGVDVCLGDDAVGDADFDGLCDDADFVLEVWDLAPGQQATFRVSAARPASRVYVLGSTTGTGNGPCLATYGVCSGLRRPFVLGSRVVDAFGNAELRPNVPTSVPVGQVVVFRAAWVDAATSTGAVSNYVSVRAGL